MNVTRSSRAALTGAATLFAFTLAGVTPATAAPYTNDAVLTVSTTNPAIGGTLTITLINFGSGELIDIDLHSTVVRLTTVQADTNGAASAVVTLPANFTCEHFITATGRSTGEVARTDLLIGPPSACNRGGNTGSGNTGRGNTGHGNTGHGNTGHGNTGNNNTGHGNTGDGNTGHGNTGYDDSGWGNVSYVRAISGSESHAPEVALASITGLALVGGAGFLHRRRSAR